MKSRSRGGLVAVLALVFGATLLTMPAAFGQNVDSSRTVAMISGNSSPPKGDRPAKTWLTDAGWAVTVFADDAIPDNTTLEGFDAVVVMSSVLPASIPARIGDLAVGVLNTEVYLMGDLALGTQQANVNSQTQLDINEVPPITDGVLTGVQRVSTSAQFGLGTPGAGATIIADALGSPTQSAIWVYEAGDLLTNGTPAPGRRGQFYFNYSTPTAANTVGQQLFLNTVEWVADSPADWVQVGADINGEAGDHLGGNVAMSADGNTIIAGLGSDVNGTNSGAARVLRFDGIDWLQVGADINGEAAYDSLGSVAMSADGNTIIAGSPGSNFGNSGAARVFRFDGTDWVQIGADINGEAQNDGFGRSVAMSADGNTIIASAPDNNGNGTDSGHVRAFRFDGTDWLQVGTDIDGEAAYDYFGAAVAMSADGNTIIASAPDDDGYGSGAGYVRVFRFDGTDWVQVGARIDGDVEAVIHTGWAVAMSADGNTIIAGATGYDGNADFGQVRVFRFDGTDWVQVGSDINGVAEALSLDVAMSADGNTIIAGSWLLGGASDHVRVFRFDRSDWVQVGARVDGGVAFDAFGSEVAISADGNTIMAGAPISDGNGIDSGFVRVFTSPFPPTTPPTTTTTTPTTTTTNPPTTTTTTTTTTNPPTTTTTDPPTTTTTPTTLPPSAGTPGLQVVDANGVVVGPLAAPPVSGWGTNPVLVAFGSDLAWIGQDGKMVPLDVPTQRLYFESEDCTGAPTAANDSNYLLSWYDAALPWPAEGPLRKPYKVTENDLSWSGISNTFNSSYGGIGSRECTSGPQGSSNGWVTPAVEVVAALDAPLFDDFIGPLTIEVAP